MTKTAGRIGLFGYFGSENLGNEGSLEAMANLLRSARPDAELVCICVGPERASADHGIAAIAISPPDFSTDAGKLLNRVLLKVPRRLQEFLYTLRELRKLDAVLVPGTGILDDFGERPQAMPYALFRWSLMARLLRRPFAFISVGAGPIIHPLSLRLMRAAARLASFRTYRDRISRDFMQQIGIDTSEDQIFPDIAFRLEHPVSQQRSVMQNGPLAVGMGVMDYSGWTGSNQAGAQIHATYVEKITRFVIWLLQQGHAVRILIGQKSDWQVAKEIMKRVETAVGSLQPERMVAEQAGSLHDVMTQMDQTDIVIATRFHNIVCALISGKPAISLGYADKNSALLADFGLGDYCQHVEQIDFDLLVDQFRKLSRDREEHVRRIRNRVTEYHQQLGLQDQRILRELV